MYYEVACEGETLFGKPYLKIITFKQGEEELLGNCIEALKQDDTIKKIIVKTCETVLTKDE